MGQKATSAVSLDHLVGGHKQRSGGHGEAKRLRRLEIDGQFEFGRLEDWNLAWPRALKDFADHVSDAGPTAGKSIP